MSDEALKHFYILASAGGLQVVTGRDMDNHAWGNALPKRFEQRAEAEHWRDTLTRCASYENARLEADVKRLRGLLALRASRSAWISIPAYISLLPGICDLRAVALIASISRPLALPRFLEA